MDENSKQQGGPDVCPGKRKQLDLQTVREQIEETTGPDGSFFGARNALDVVRACRDAPARVIVEEVHRAVARFTEGRPQIDDVTTVVIKVL